MPVEKSSDGAMQKVLQDLGEFPEQGSKNIRENDLMFLKVIMDSPVIQSLAKVHDTLESSHFSCSTKDASEIVKQIIHDIEGMNFTPAHELCQLLKSSHVLSILTAHDVIAKQYVLPTSKQYINNPPESFDLEEWQNAVRMIGLTKRAGESLGLTVSLCNDDIVVSRILHGGLIHKQGLLHVGDIIREVNGQDVKGNPALLKNQLSKSNDSYVFKIIPSYVKSCAPGDVYMKCNFGYNPDKDTYIPSKEAGLQFEINDVLKIVYRNDHQWWQAQHVNEKGEPCGRAGLIPSSELEERRRVLTGQALPKIKKQVCKMYKLSDYYNEYADDFLPYEEVAKLPPFARKCIILVSHNSSVSHQVKNELVETFPELYKAPVTHTTCATTKDHYEIVTKDAMLKDIKENKFFEFAEIKDDLFGTRYDSLQHVMKSGKSCVKDVSLKNLKFLMTSQFMPYVIFLKPMNDSVDCSAHCVNKTLTHHSVQASCANIHKCLGELSKSHQWVPVSWLY